MQGLRQPHCMNCGGDVRTVDEHTLKCNYCGSTFENRAFQKKSVTLQEFLDQSKLAYVENQRRNLYDAVCAKYISKTEVLGYATEIKKYLPDDFQANFYLNALSGDAKKTNELIRGINADENYDLLPPIFRFLITSLESEFLLELNLLAERAYKKRDLALYSKISTQISEEAEKVSAGVYETIMPRDVFIAYSSKDMPVVSKLCEELEEQGFTCFVAARNLRHGVGSVENYDAALKEAMDYCTCFLFVSSVNSRRFDCDAVRKEIPYIRSVDMQNAPPEFRYNYKTMPAKYKKPRIEYRIGSIVRSATNTITNEFFDGYEWVYDTDGVLDRLTRILTASPDFCNHVEVVEPAVAATCTAPGRTEGAHCSLCGEVLRQSTVIPPTGHLFGGWHITKQATCTENGKQERSCHCGETETMTFPSLGGHRPGAWETVKEPTEYETGLRVRGCVVCGERVASESIPKKPIKREATAPVAMNTEAPAPRTEPAATRIEPAATKIEPHKTAPVTTKTAPVTVTMKTEPAATKIEPAATRIEPHKTAPTVTKPKPQPSSANPEAGVYTYNVRILSCGNQKLKCARLMQNTFGITLQKGTELCSSKAALSVTSQTNKSEIVALFRENGFEIEVEGGEAAPAAKAEAPKPVSILALTKAAMKGDASSQYALALRYENGDGTAKDVKKATEWYTKAADAGDLNAKKALDRLLKQSLGASAQVSAKPRTAPKASAPKTGLAYKVNADRRTCTVIGKGTCTDKAIVIPAVIDGYRVTAIATETKDLNGYPTSGFDAVTSISIPDSVTKIGDAAFSDCARLKSITIPDSVKTVGAAAFYGCARLTDVTIPDSVTSLGEKVFCACEQLTSVVIGGSVTSIPDRAFHDCESLESVSLGNTVTDVGKWAFRNCDSLTEIRYHGTKKQWSRIRLGAAWNDGAYLDRIECDDGDVSL